jgi:hypothetical protein
MQWKKAFIISYYDITDNYISFKGRVLSDISIGDKLIYISDENEIGISKEYTVQKIVAYRKELEFINEGMTCEIVASGDDLEFKEDELLYI